MGMFLRSSNSNPIYWPTPDLGALVGSRLGHEAPGPRYPRRLRLAPASALNAS